MINYRKYYEKMKNIQTKLMLYIEDNNDTEENYENLKHVISEESIIDNAKIFKEFLQLLSKIAKNHNRTAGFLKKIQEILILFKDDIKKKFSNYEINQNKGENENYICELIRSDSISDYSLDSYIKTSIFETNTFLLKNYSKLIEYTAFYGSIQIFKYLYKNNAKTTPKIWLYAIHGNNPELISFLEENYIEPEYQNYDKCLEESIKCHHNEMSDYILQNYINYKEVNEYDSNIYTYSFHYQNYIFFPKELNNNFFFINACEYNYIDIVKFYIDNKEININIICSKIDKYQLNITPLYLAAKRNNVEIVDFLLKQPNIQINKRCFANCEKLTKIEFLPLLPLIEEYTFFGCESLTEIKVPSSVKSIEKDAFNRCKSLKNITIPSSVSIGNGAFYQCISLVQILLEHPISVTSIDDNAFSYCKSLNQIIIPPLITLIKYSTFSYCSSLEYITIPSSIISIESNEFRGCSSLKQITIPSSVESIGNSIFLGCSSLKQVMILSSLTLIKYSTFGGCSSLEDIIIPSSVQKIRDEAFSNCYSLKNITIPSSVNYIGSYAFSQCISLTKVSIYSSKIEIGQYPFILCSSIKEISINRSIALNDMGIFHQKVKVTKLNK